MLHTCVLILWKYIICIWRTKIRSITIVHNHPKYANLVGISAWARIPSQTKRFCSWQTLPWTDRIAHKKIRLCYGWYNLCKMTYKYTITDEKSAIVGTLLHYLTSRHCSKFSHISTLSSDRPNVGALQSKSDISKPEDGILLNTDWRDFTNLRRPNFYVCVGPKAYTGLYTRRILPWNIAIWCSFKCTWTLRESPREFWSERR